jgi:hypothetical protein
MGIKSLSLSLALLAVIMLSLLHPSLAGTGCGSNWMGDTSGDTDFWVSNNQNLGTSGLASDSASTSAKPAVALGSAAKEAASENSNATISRVKVSRPSPQSPGSAIIWTVEASNPGNEPMLYDFQLSGSSTGGEYRDMTGWTDQSTWTWNTTQADAGENQIWVLVTRQGSAAYEDSRTLSYRIGSDLNESTNSAASPGPSAGTVPQPQLDILGANMRVPDTKPTPLAQDTSAGYDAEAAQPSTSEPEEPETLDVEGKWTIRLENAGISLNPLNLIQNGESIMGSGTFNEGGSKLQVTATGTVSRDAMSLHVWTVVSEYGNKIDKSVDLDLVQVDRIVSGSYELYSGEELLGSGNATASRAAA